MLLVRDGETLALGMDVRGDIARFAGFDPGACKLWFDCPGFAPQRLDGVVLREGLTDLGVLALGRGATVRFHVLPREDERIPELSFTAQALGAPRYRRSAKTTGADHALLGGLGAGRFQVTVSERYTGQQVWSRRIEVDGTNEVSVEIDLR